MVVVPQSANPEKNIKTLIQIKNKRVKLLAKIANKGGAPTTNSSNLPRVIKERKRKINFHKKQRIDSLKTEEDESETFVNYESGVEEAFAYEEDKIFTSGRA